ncbi:Uu.00g073350.m01.CDS01 [Anthostomella pinea]|uniref:Uu.00g073350.m01.CDS01 n=1 Tax=Anthostomella pinea TaxID=933095 RepID=A0AAI8VVW2_9PEZI|nr:Uu.00g073350.m01.CDS01 [Anthostomella pinea]
MEPFPSAQEPDEGYSEHPLNTFAAGDLENDAATLGLPPRAQLPAWLSARLPKLSVQEKKCLAMLILKELPTTAIADIVMNQLNPRLYIDFVERLPPEICLKILGYLDPVSLIHVAICCRGWYNLALDRKLWEKLFYMEGWKAIPSEILAAEQRMNAGLLLSQMQPQGVQSVEDGHVHKKRAVSDPTPPDDDDYEMVDADLIRQDHRDTDMSGTSLFGGPQPGGSGSSIQSNTSVVQHMGNLMMKSPSPMPGLKGKAVARPTRTLGKAAANPPDGSSHVESTFGSPTLPQTRLWIYDTRDRRYKISWKYLYTMRRRLEKNWDSGRYTNFQLPHPDHMDEGHNECIYSLQYNPEYLVSGSRDRTLRIWNLRTRRLIRPPLKGHQGSVLCLQFDSDPDEDLIVSGSSDSDVILWKFSTGQIIQRLRRAHTESVLNVKFDKRILVTCSKDKSIKIFNRTPLRAGDVGYGYDHGVGPVPIHLRNYGYDDSPLNQLPIKPPFTMIACLEGHNAAVNAVQICNREIVSASGDRNIKVWDWPTQTVKRTFIGHAKGIACVQYDGRRIVSGSSDNEVKVFDVESGLEVASLRAHGNLVRTVQAGFGDLPYSREEDRLEAKAVDQAYFSALTAGTLQELQKTRSRPHNAGSRRPQDITAYGAKLPPGGGGGPYGRIVSGSYDQQIIIWRRDREGIWRTAHILRQEEGAAAALRQNSRGPTSVLSRRPTPSPADVIDASDSQTDQPSGSRPPHPPASAPPALQRPPPSYTHVEYPIIATITPQTTASYTQMIDACVPQGPGALQQALMAYPTILTYHSHIQTAIDREPNAITRSQLRQVVSAALVRAQIAQNRVRDSVHRALTATSGPAEPSTSQAAHVDPQVTPRQNSSSMVAASNASHLDHDATPHASNGGGPPVTANGAHHPHPSLSQQHEQTQPAAATAPAQAQAPPPQQPQTHPHIAQADTSPARIFKLQFDARRIICCSQISTIVGWDFCNGDPELEEAARFFGTVD